MNFTESQSKKVRAKIKSTYGKLKSFANAAGLQDYQVSRHLSGQEMDIMIYIKYLILLGFIPAKKNYIVPWSDYETFARLNKLPLKIKF